jgi:hypothetical protein
MRKARFLGLLTMFSLGVAGISGLSVYITNDNTDMINAKKICVHLSFDPGEVALYKDTLCISVDAPDLELKGWRTTAQAPAAYASTFKKQRRLFTESFNLEILIDFEKNNRQAQMDVLSVANVSVSSLILTNQGTNKAENVVVPLKTTNVAEDLVLTVTTSGPIFASEYTSTLLPYQRSFEFFKGNERLVGKQDINEVLVIDRMKELWRVASTKVVARTAAISFYKWYLVLWVLLLLLLLRWLYPIFRFVIPVSMRWHRELFIVVCLAVMILSWWQARGLVAPQVWYGALGALCAPASFYYLWGETETVLDRLKVLIGIIFAVALPPLVVLAYIHLLPWR